MKKLIIAVKKGDLYTVRKILEREPELIYVISQPPPMKQAGQSLLQLALRACKFDVAEYLLTYDTDVNYMEPESTNNWRAPVIQDAVTAAIKSSRWNTNDNIKGIQEFNTKKKADAGFRVLKKMINMGADITVKDSYGMTCIERAVLDARQILPFYHYGERRMLDDRILTETLRKDLKRIFNLLLRNGADIHVKDRYDGKELREMYENEPVAQFLVKKKRN